METDRHMEWNTIERQTQTCNNIQCFRYSRKGNYKIDTIFLILELFYIIDHYFLKRLNRSRDI